MNYRILLLSLFASFVVTAQTTAFRFHALGVNEGLSQGNVTCLLKDHDGLMWMGTWDGLNVYDGFSIKTYRQSSKQAGSLKGSLVNSIFETSAQELYVATSQSLHRFDPRRGNFIHFDLDQTPHDIRILRQQKQQLLLSVNNELWWFHLQTHVFTRVQNKVTPIWNSYFKNNKTAVNHSEFLMNGLYSFFEHQVSHVNLYADFFQHHTVNDVIPIGANYVWATDDGLWILDSQQHTFKGLYDSVKFKCIARSGSQVFVGTQTAGLWILDAATLKVKQKLQPDERQKFSLAGNFVRTLFIDEQQMLWASVLGNGVNACSLKPDAITTLLYKHDTMLMNVADHYIKAIAEDTSRLLWVASVTGNVYVFDRGYHLIKTFTPSQINAQEKPSSIQQIFVSTQGELFLLTEKGLYVRKGTWSFEKINSPALNANQQYISSMHALNDSCYLLGTREGLCQLLTKPRVMITPASTSLNYRQVILNTYTDAHGHVYINPMFGGIDVYAFSQGQYRLVKQLQTGFNVKQFVERDSILWMATTMGILQLNTVNFTTRWLDESDGLPNQNIYCLLPDPLENQAFWCSSNKGIFRVNPFTRSIFPLNLEMGLLSLEFNTHAYALRTNGDMVFGSTNGMAIVQPSKNLQTPPATHLLFNDMQAEGLLASNYFDTTQAIYRIPYRHNSFSGILLALHYPALHSTLRYRLQGYDKHWVEVPNHTEIRYAKLPIGEYALQVWDEQQWRTLARIEIVAPWYLTIWAFLAYIFLLLYVVYALIQAYLRKKLNEKKQEQIRQDLLMQERDRISADLHDDIGSTLSSISIYSELIGRYANEKPDMVSTLSDKIASQSKELISRTEDIIWSLKIGRQQHDPIQKRLKEYAVDLLQPVEMECRLEIQEEVNTLLQQPVQRRALLMLLKEAMNNARKYSQGTSMTIQLSTTSSHVLLQVTDNGRGFDASKTAYGDGIENMKARCQALKGSFTLTTAPGEGVRIQCLFPIAIFSYTHTMR